MKSFFATALLCLAFETIILSQEVKRSEQNASFFVVEFVDDVAGEVQQKLTEQYAKLEGVNHVNWMDAKRVCLITDKRFSIKSIKPGVERFELTIERYTEDYRPYSSSCPK